MRHDLLMRAWCALVILGGALLIAGGIAELRVDETGDRPLSSTVNEPGFLLHIRLNLAGYALVLLGLPVLALRLARKRAGIAAASSILLAAGLLFITSFSLFMAFIAPVLATQTPTTLDGEWQAPMSWLNAGFPIFFLSMLIFAAVALWLGTLPRVAAGVLLVGVIASATDLRLDGVVFGGAALAWMGVDAWRNNDA